MGICEEGSIVLKRVRTSGRWTQAETEGFSHIRTKLEILRSNIFGHTHSPYVP